MKIYKNTIYALKRQYGVSIYLTTPSDVTINPTTGAVTKTENTVLIRRAILLPARMRQVFNVSGAPFNYGGYIDVGARLFILDGADVAIKVDMSSSIRFGDKIWKPQYIDFSADTNLYTITAKEVDAIVSTTSTLA